MPGSGDPESRGKRRRASPPAGSRTPWARGAKGAGRGAAGAGRRRPRAALPLGVAVAERGSAPLSLLASPGAALASGRTRPVRPRTLLSAPGTSRLERPN